MFPLRWVSLFLLCICPVKHIILLAIKRLLLHLWKKTHRCCASFCCLTLKFITRISGNGVIFGFSRMNCSTGSSLHAMDPGLGTMEVPALGALSPDYVVGNFSPAELGEKRDLIWVFFFCCLYFWIWLLHGDLEFSLLLLRTGFAVWWIEMLLLSCWCLPLSWFIWIPSDYAVIVCPLSG